MNFKRIIPPNRIEFDCDNWFFQMEDAWTSEHYLVMSQVKNSIRHIVMCRKDGKKMEYIEKFNIKNVLFGDNVKAIEIYPPKNKLLDDRNVYHLWVFENGCDELDQIEL